MFESLRIEDSITHSDITASLVGNPFTIKAIVGSGDGRFVGASFIEVRRGDHVVPARAFCSDYGVEHHYDGADAEALTQLCEALNRDLEQQYNITFLEREPAMEEMDPVPPEQENQETNGEEGR